MILLFGGASVCGFAQLGNADAAGLIKLDVSVTDGAGNTVSGLDPKDFTLLDQGQPQTIRTVETFGRSDPTVEIILLLDGLKLSPTQDAQEGLMAATFLRQNGGHLVHPVSIFHLGYEGLGVIARSSGDGNELAQEVERDKEVMLRSAIPKSNGGIKDLQAIPEEPLMTGLKAPIQPHRLMSCCRTCSRDP